MASDLAAVTRKVKLLCSFGGRIFPRPSDGKLRYVGGHTRIVALSRDAPLQEVLRKVSDAYGGPAVLKYQLPGEDLDALVSVSSGEDLENMMEEYDKLVDSSPEGSAKLRVFLFSPGETDCVDLGFGAEDVNDGEQRYVEAVNDVGGSGIGRKESVASVSSMQNSDGGACELLGGASVDSVPPSVVPAETATTLSDDSSRVVFGLSSDPFFPEPNRTMIPVSVQDRSGAAPQSFDSSQLFPPLGPSSGMTYIPQPHMTPLQDGFNYLNSMNNPSQIQHMESQQLGMTGVPVGFVAVPQHSYLPSVHITTGMPTSQVSREQPGRIRTDAHFDDVLSVGKITQVAAGDPAHKPFQALSEFPPLPPSALLGQKERQGLCQVPPLVTAPGQSARPEESGLSQRSLPHAHSDPLVHVGNDSTSDIGNKSPVFYSLHSGAAGTHAFSDTMIGMMPDTSNAHQLHNVVPPHSGPYGYNQTPELHKDLKVAPQGAENLDQPIVLLPPGLGFTVPQAPHGLYFYNHPHRWSENTLQQSQMPPFGQPQQYLYNHNPISGHSLGVDISSVRNDSLQNSELAVQDAEVDSPFDYSRPAKMDPSYINQFQISGSRDDQRPVSVKPHLGDSAATLENCHIDPSGTLVASEQLKAVNRTGLGKSSEVSLENLRLVEENRDNRVSNVRTGDELLGSTSSSSNAAVEANSFKPVDLLPYSSFEVTSLSNFHPGDSNQVYPVVGNVGPYSCHLEMSIEPPIPTERLLQGHSAASRISTIMDRKDDNSRLYTGSGNCVNDASTPLIVTLPFQSSTMNTYNMNSGSFPIHSELLSRNLQPLNNMQSNPIPAVKPSTGDVNVMLPSSDLCIDDHVRADAKSNIPAQLQEVDYHLPLDFPISKEVMKQELQTDAELLADPVSQQSAHACGPYALENNSASEYQKDMGIEDINVNKEQILQSFDHRTEVVKVGQLDKLNIGVQIEDLGRLQIIKNDDLEELRELGSGTFGTVYHGKWRGSDVAIKRINDRCFAGKKSEQENSRADFWNEACKLADLHHPNVVAFYGVVLDGTGGSVATVTEYMVNGSLRQVLVKNDKTFDRRKRLLIAMDVAFGMEYLHGKNIVHFDLKSDNLLVNLRDPQRPICKVGDLGLSKIKCQTLISGGVRGTLPWMAPELLNGSSSLVSEKMSLFSRKNTALSPNKKNPVEHRRYRQQHAAASGSTIL